MIISTKHLKGTLHLTKRIHIFHQRYEPLLHSILKPSSASGGDLLQCLLQSVTMGDFYRYKQCGGRPSIPRAVPALHWHQSVPRTLNTSPSCRFSFFSNETNGMRRLHSSSSRILSASGGSTRRWAAAVCPLKALSEKQCHLMGHYVLLH